MKKLFFRIIQCDYSSEQYNEVTILPNNTMWLFFRTIQWSNYSSEQYNEVTISLNNTMWLFFRTIQ